MEVDQNEGAMKPKKQKKLRPRISVGIKRKRQKDALNNALKDAILQQTCYTSIAKELPLPYPMAFETTEEGGAYISNIKVGDVTYNVKGKGEDSFAAENRASDNFLKLYFTQWVPAVDQEDNFPYDLLVKYAVVKLVGNAANTDLDAGAVAANLTASVGALAAQRAPTRNEPWSWDFPESGPIDAISMLHTIMPSVKFEFQKGDFGFQCECELFGVNYVGFGRSKKEAKRVCAEKAYRQGVLMKEKPLAGQRPNRAFFGTFGYGGPSDGRIMIPRGKFGRRMPYRPHPFSVKFPVMGDGFIH